MKKINTLQNLKPLILWVGLSLTVLLIMGCPCTPGEGGCPCTPGVDGCPCQPGYPGCPDPKECKKCDSIYPAYPINDLDFGQVPAAAREDDEVGFLFDNWCTGIQPEDSAECGCEWTLDQMELTNVPDNFCWGDSATVTVRIPKNTGVVLLTYRIVLDNDGTLLPSDLMIVEGVSISIDLPEGCLSEGIGLRLGGLCVIENIDGGDDECI